MCVCALCVFAICLRFLAGAFCPVFGFQLLLASPLPVAGCARSASLSLPLSISLHSSPPLPLFSLPLGWQLISLPVSPGIAKTLITRGLAVSFECRVWRACCLPHAACSLLPPSPPWLPCGLHKFCLKYFLKSFATHTRDLWLRGHAQLAACCPRCPHAPARAAARAAR